MKKLSLFLLFISLVSCQITERFYLNQDGSVAEEKEIDLSAVIEMAASMDPDSDFSQVSVDTIVDADSDIQSILPSEVTVAMDGFEELRKEMDQSTFHIVLNKDQYVITIRSEAKDINELNSYNEKLNRVKDNLQVDASDQATLNFARYQLDENKFERVITGPLVVTQGANEELEQSMIEAFIFRMEYHFPKKLKDVSLKEAKISEDGKSMVFGDQLSNILKYEDEFKNFSVTFR